jgi:hypothetical protein
MSLASGVAARARTEPHSLARYRNEFPIFRDKIYLNTCSLGALGDRPIELILQGLRSIR